jgi:hypothetical protein
MKTIAKFLACSPLLAAALLLSACGGGAIDASVGGTMAGLSGGTSAVLVNNGSDPITVGANGTFTFDQQIQSGAAYSVTVQTQPIGETCLVTDGSGTIDSEGDDITSVVVTCYATGTQPAAAASATSTPAATN